MARLFCFYGLLVTAVIVHKKIDEWYIEWQRVVQRETTSDNKWQRVTTNDSEWQRVVILANFPFFRIRKKPTTMHPKETF